MGENRSTKGLEIKKSYKIDSLFTFPVLKNTIAMADIFNKINLYLSIRISFSPHLGNH